MAMNKHLDAGKVEDYFKDMKAFVDCLETLYPKHLTTPQDIRDQLDRVRLA